MGDADTASFLIIGGTTKSGTSSLFRYLSDHPQVCPSDIKETRYFLPSSYPLHARHRHEADPLSHYCKWFSTLPTDVIRMEATPDYLHSAEAAQAIKSSLNNAKMIFILRDPLSRLISWYQFAQQNGFVDKAASFEDFIAMQHDSKTSKEHVAQHQLAMMQGRYSNDIKMYLESLGAQRCLILDFASLISHPYEVAQRVCQFAGLDASYYRNYSFEIVNKTYNSRFSKLHLRYITQRYIWRERLSNHPFLFKAMRVLKRILEPLYLMVNRQEPTAAALQPATKDKLEKYYEQDAQMLNLLLRQHTDCVFPPLPSWPPWLSSANRSGDP